MNKTITYNPQCFFEVAFPESTLTVITCKSVSLPHLDETDYEEY